VLIVSVAILAASHGAGVVPVSCVIVYLLLTLGIRAFFWPRHLWVAVLIGLATLPWVINSFFRGVSHIHELNEGVVAETLAGWFLGYNPALTGWWIVLGAGLVAAGLIGGLLAGPSRAMVVAFILWPVAFVLLVSVLLRPIWIARLIEFCAPFACIALAATAVWAWRALEAVGLAARAAFGALAAVVLIVMTHASIQQSEQGRKMEYREAAAWLRAHVPPGGVIYAPEHMTFWGIARYFAGPNWGSALSIQDPVRPAKSNAWDPIYAKLGPAWLRWLDLIPEKREIDAHGARLIIGFTPSEVVRDARAVWLVASGSIDPAELAVCDAQEDQPMAFRGMTIHALRCDFATGHTQ